MTTITPTPEEMERRIARFKTLQIMSSQARADIPQDVLDIIFARQLKPVITLGGDTESPFGSVAPIVGAAGISVTFAICPPGNGPSLHAHNNTYETFTVMRGRFEFRWGDWGEHAVVLDEFDTLSVPPAIHRSFRNVSEADGVLQVVVSGGVHDRRDIVFPRKTADEICSKDPRYLDYFRDVVGLQFG